MIDVWLHDEIKRKLDQILAGDYNAHYDLAKIGVQQDKAVMLSTDASIFMLIPRNELLRVSDEQLIYLAKQLFAKAQRRFVRKFCPNTALGTGNICGAALDSRANPDMQNKQCQPPETCSAATMV